MTDEITIVGMLVILNTLGWGAAIWFGKRHINDLSVKVDSLIEKISGTVPQGECDEKRSKLWGKIDAIRTDQKEDGKKIERLLGRLEGPKT